MRNKGTKNKGTKEAAWSSIQQSEAFASLDEKDKQALVQVVEKHRFSFSQLKQLVDIAVDFRTWDERPFANRLEEARQLEGKLSSGGVIFDQMRQEWERLKTDLKNYKNFKGQPSMKSATRQMVIRPKSQLGFGQCPVASPKTRCCNLKTLDSVEGCSFDCSYCAVKTFYRPGEIVIDSTFASKLETLQLDPNKAYHIGTGQSSDSLLFGNKEGQLDALIALAKRYPKVIIELKTKSNNVTYLLKQSLPPNLLFTWSLNTPTIIKAEEHGTASLKQRLDAADQMAKKGALVGFHFHPIVDYVDSIDEYTHLYQLVQRKFNPDDVVLVSFGTLTFTRPIIKQLRKVSVHSKILQMPLVEAGGKFSYPLLVKKKMFSHAYKAFGDWHNEVFFYLCMEDATLWSEVFSFEYANNDAFEDAMIGHYEKKIDERKKTIDRGN